MQPINARNVIKNNKFLKNILILFKFLDSFSSSAAPPTGLSHMARMMDSLILDQYPPFAFTKITTTHRPTKTGNIKKTETTRTTSMGGLVPPQTSTGLGIRLKNRIPTQGLFKIFSPPLKTDIFSETKKNIYNYRSVPTAASKYQLALN